MNIIYAHKHKYISTYKHKWTYALNIMIHSLKHHETLK